MTGLPVVVFRHSDSFKREYPSFRPVDMSDAMHQQRYSVPRTYYIIFYGDSRRSSCTDLFRLYDFRATTSRGGYSGYVNCRTREFYAKMAKDLLAGILEAAKSILDQ